MKWLAEKRYSFIDTCGIASSVHQFVNGEWAFGAVVAVFMFLLSGYVDNAANRVTKK
jgi:hypothetical protein